MWICFWQDAPSTAATETVTRQEGWEGKAGSIAVSWHFFRPSWRHPSSVNSPVRQSFCFLQVLGIAVLVSLRPALIEKKRPFLVLKGAKAVVYIVELSTFAKSCMPAPKPCDSTKSVYTTFKKLLAEGNTYAILPVKQRSGDTQAQFYLWHMWVFKVL